MSNELKPCPFCGSPAEFTEPPAFDTVEQAVNDMAIGCTNRNCGMRPAKRVRTQRWSFKDGNYREDMSAALRTEWNTRDADHAAVVEPPATSEKRSSPAEAGAAQPVRAMEWWVWCGELYDTESGARAEAIMRGGNPDEVFYVREVLPQSAGSLEKEKPL